MCITEWHNIYTICITLKKKAMNNSTTTSIILKVLDLNLKTILEQDIRAFQIAQQNKRRAALQLIAA